MLNGFGVQTRQILVGNLSLIVCCVFYLAWWLISFKPSGGIKGFKSGWLLIPAAVFGIASVVWIIEGSVTLGIKNAFIPNMAILFGGILCYIILLIISTYVLKRQVTSELMLIVVWTMLMFLELSALYGQGCFSMIGTILLLVITLIGAAVSLVCYILYYNLDKVKGYVDGMIPLLIVIVMMAAVSIAAAVGTGRN